MSPRPGSPPPWQPRQPWQQQRPDLRIGDAERERAATQLAEHYAVGRLTQEEHAERLDRIWAARTQAELDPVFVDLPGHATAAPPPWQQAASRPGNGRAPGRVPVGDPGAAAGAAGGARADRRRDQLPADPHRPRRLVLLPARQLRPAVLVGPPTALVTTPFLRYSSSGGWVQVVAQVFPMYWIGLGMRSAFLPDAAAAQEIGGSWRTAETVAVLGAWAVVGALVTPVLLRRMARRQTGSQVEAAREASMQWVRSASRSLGFSRFAAVCGPLRAPLRRRV